MRMDVVVILLCVLIGVQSTPAPTARTAGSSFMHTTTAINSTTINRDRGGTSPSRDTKSIRCSVISVSRGNLTDCEKSNLVSVCVKEPSYDQILQEFATSLVIDTNTGCQLKHICDERSCGLSNYTFVIVVATKDARTTSATATSSDDQCEFVWKIGTIQAIISPQGSDLLEVTECGNLFKELLPLWIALIIVSALAFLVLIICLLRQCLSSTRKSAKMGSDGDRLQTDGKLQPSGTDNPALEYSDSVPSSCSPPSSAANSQDDHEVQISVEDQEKFDNGIVPFDVEDTRM